MKLGPPNPLEECMSQFSDTKLGSQRCHMELCDEKLANSPLLGSTIWSTPSELQCVARGTLAQYVT